MVGDLSGFGNNGTISTSRGGPTWVTTGRFGGALSFDGNNDLVSVNNSASLSMSTAVTMEAWVNPASVVGWRTILMKEAAIYYLYASSTSGGPMTAVNIGGYRELVGPTALPVNTWSHVAGTYDGTALRLYVNGQLVATQALSGPIGVSSSPLNIGGNINWGEYFSGRIDEVRVYNRALSQTEIQSDMNRPILPGAP